jgi:hypothetical protein
MTLFLEGDMSRGPVLLHLDDGYILCECSLAKRRSHYGSSVARGDRMPHFEKDRTGLGLLIRGGGLPVRLVEMGLIAKLDGDRERWSIISMD